VSDVQAPLAVLDLRRQVEDYLDGLAFSLATSTQVLRDAMSYALLTGGDRLRAVTALATAGALGHAPGSVLPLAAALEMIHTHSLIHLDLPAMAGCDVRGGKPAAHVVFGQDVALLAGDALFAEAITLVLHEQQGEASRVLAASAELMQAAGVAGLVGALYADCAPTQDLHDDRLRQAYELRTGGLLACAVGTVLILTGETGPGAASLRRFGAAVGVLSQIVDDVLDATAQAKLLGGPGDRDRAAPRGRSTYVTAFGLVRARELAREAHAHASAALAEAPRDRDALQRVADILLARQSPGV
jgi:geranylgeranyl diphosphate synthase type II